MLTNSNIYSLTEPPALDDFLRTLAEECSFPQVKLEERLPHRIILRVFQDENEDVKSYFIAFYSTFEGLRIEASSGFSKSLIKVAEFYLRHGIKPALSNAPMIVGSVRNTDEGYFVKLRMKRHALQSTEEITIHFSGFEPSDATAVWLARSFQNYFGEYEWKVTVHSMSPSSWLTDIPKEWK